MSELTSTGVILPRRQNHSMGLLAFLLAFARHHLRLVSREKSLQKDSAIPKPLQVKLTDGTGWNLDERSGVYWHLSYPGRGKQVVPSAKVAGLPCKWDMK